MTLVNISLNRSEYCFHPRACVSVCMRVCFYFAKQAINRSLIQFLCWAVLFCCCCLGNSFRTFCFSHFLLTWHTNCTRCVNLINYIGKKKINSVNESIYGASVSLFQPIFQMQCVVFILDFFLLLYTGAVCVWVCFWTQRAGMYCYEKLSVLNRLSTITRHQLPSSRGA